MDKWGPEYSISFEIKLKPMPKGVWYNFIHLTSTNKNDHSYGARIPALFFRNDNGKTPYMHVTVAQTKGQNQRWHNIMLEENKWYKIRLDHKIVDTTEQGGKFTVTLDEKVVWTVDKLSSIEYKNVKLYQSDPWYGSIAPFAEVGCLEVATSKESLEETFCSLLECENGCTCKDGDCQCSCASKKFCTQKSF